MLQKVVRTSPAALSRQIRPSHVFPTLSTLSRRRVLSTPLQPRTSIAAFHSTPQRNGSPLIPIFAAILKSSTSLELARMASRVVLTFIPFILWSNAKSKRKLKWAALHGKPKSEETVAKVHKHIQYRKYFLYGLLLVPLTLFWGTIVASLEQTPLTGRWRLIILSPEEEEEIANQLAGPGWYNAVGEMLSHDGPPKIIPNTDWRHAWVNSTLRRLEATIPILTNEPTTHESWFDEDQDRPPMPPPAQYPLRPRPRAAEYFRRVCDNICEGRLFKPPNPRMPHTIAGPPYSLLIVDDPDSSNAFSYGFGPNGGGGIVVYSGFLDEVLSRTPMQEPPPAEKSKSFLSYLFGGLFSSPPPRHPTPTPEQTSELAILLAHELSHLILSHHLESLSSTTVIVPGTISILTDIARVLVFPFTMMFGPFVNDAVAQLGKVGSGELIKVGEFCTSVRQEIEADVVSARLLAHAGFDARDPVKFWEVRSSEEYKTCSMDTEARQSFPAVRRIMGSGHPVNELRIDALQHELSRWEKGRLAAVAKQKGES